MGALAIAGACLAWAIDNKCTSKIAHVEAPTLAAIKGLGAGTANLLLSSAVGARLPAVGVIALAGVIGFFGYGVSLVLFVLALREIGAARTGAYFSTAPFLGAVFGLILLREPWNAAMLVSGALMALGVWLHLSEPQAPE